MELSLGLRFLFAVWESFGSPNQESTLKNTWFYDFKCRVDGPDFQGRAQKGAEA